MPDNAPQIDPVVAADLAALVLELSHDKDTRKDFGRLVRKKKPNSKHANAFADVDQEDRFEAFKREQEEKELKREQEQLTAQLAARRQALLDGDTQGRKYSEDDVKKIEALMEKKGLIDYDDGAALYAATLPPVTKPDAEIPVNGGSWEFPSGMDDYFKNADKAARNEAHKVIGEMMRKRG